MSPVELNWQPLATDYQMSTLAIGGRRAMVSKLFGLLALLWALFVVFLVLANAATPLTALGSLVIALLLCLVTLRVGPVLTAKFFLKRNPDMLAPAIARVDEDGIKIWQAERVISCSWDQIRQWTETPEVIYCQIDIDKDRSFIGLPKRATANAAELESLRDTLRAHAPQR